MLFIFIVCQGEGYQYVSKLSYRPLVFTSYKAFLKNKKQSTTNLLALVVDCFLFFKKAL